MPKAQSARHRASGKPITRIRPILASMTFPKSENDCGSYTRPDRRRKMKSGRRPVQPVSQAAPSQHGMTLHLTMGTLAMPVNPYQLFGLPACRTARDHMRRALLDVFPCRFLYLVAHASCLLLGRIPALILGKAVLSGGGHPPCRHGKCRTRRPAENPRLRNCTRNSGDAAGGGNARQAPGGCRQ